MPDVKLGKTPFTPAIEFLRKKPTLGTDTYTDMLNEMHDRAFVIAGVMRDDILKDVRDLIAKHMQDGTPPDQFKKDFAKTLNGRWLPKTKTGDDNTGWRAKVIYDTNVTQAYRAAEYQQLQRIKKLKPYWRYRISKKSKVHRPDHEAWDGLILSADDPWWDTHFPQNGYGCNCFVDALTPEELEGFGKTEPDQAPEVKMRKVKYGGNIIEVPEGIDPGFAYVPGKEASLWPAASPQGNPASQGVPGKFLPTDHPADNRTYKDYGRPEYLNARKTTIASSTSKDTDAIEALKKYLGGEQKVFNVVCGNFSRKAVIDAKGLGGHINKDKGRLEHIGLLEEALKPQEVWAQFVRYRNSDGTIGRLALRFKLVTTVKYKGKTLFLVCEGNDKGVLETLTFYPINDYKYINRAVRTGRLIGVE